MPTNNLSALKVLGVSNSCYSLASHQELDGRYRTSWDEVDKLVQHMNEDWNILSISDIVLNHTANESSWIHEHPESTYNCQNTSKYMQLYMQKKIY